MEQELSLAPWAAGTGLPKPRVDTLQPVVVRIGYRPSSPRAESGSYPGQGALEPGKRWRVTAVPSSLLLRPSRLLVRIQGHPGSSLPWLLAGTGQRSHSHPSPISETQPQSKLKVRRKSHRLHLGLSVSLFFFFFFFKILLSYLTLRICYFYITRKKAHKKMGV